MRGLAASLGTLLSLLLGYARQPTSISKKILNQELTNTSFASKDRSEWKRSSKRARPSPRSSGSRGTVAHSPAHSDYGIDATSLGIYSCAVKLYLGCRVRRGTKGQKGNKMRKYLLAAVALGAISTPALARDGAWYVGADFGAMIAQDTKFKINYVPASVPDGVMTIDHHPGADADIFFGYDFGMFRLEAEGAWKTADVDSIESTTHIPGMSASARVADPADGKLRVLSLMVNAMADFGNDDGLSAFIGVGAGMARVSYKGVRAFRN